MPSRFAQKYQACPAVAATFRGHEGRHFVVHGDAKVPGRFVRVSVVVDMGSGGVEAVEMTLTACRVQIIS